MDPETVDTEKAVGEAATETVETEVATDDTGDTAAATDASATEGEGTTDAAAASEAAPTAFDWKAIAGDNADLLKALEPYKGGVTDILKDAADSKAKLDAWRDLVAGDNKKLRKELDKSASPSDFGKRFNSLLSRVGDSNVVRKPTEKSSPEEITAWRQARGVPEKATDYKINLPEGAPALDTLGKALTDQFLADAHAAEMDQKQIDVSLANMERMRLTIEAERDKQVEQFRKENEDTLRGQWGPDYRRNEEYANRALQEYFPDLGPEFLNLRLENGSRVGDHAALLMGLAQLGASTGLGGSAFDDGDEGGRGQSADEEVNSLLALRHSRDANDRAKYESQPVQDRLKYLMRKVA